MKKELIVKFTIEGMLLSEDVSKCNINIRDVTTGEISMFKGLDAVLLMKELTMAAKKFEKKE